MHVIQQLPDNYTVIREIDLQKDKKEMKKVSLLAIYITLPMILVMNLFFPFPKWIDSALDDGTFGIQMAVLWGGYIAYIILHEITHGIVMKYFGGKEVRFGFTGIYAYAGSRVDYFDKYAYIRIALAPAVVWGIIFLILQFLFPSWLWVIWLLQAANLGGAAGDFHVTALTLKMSDTLRVMDTGVNMTMYDQNGTV